MTSILRAPAFPCKTTINSKLKMVTSVLYLWDIMKSLIELLNNIYFINSYVFESFEAFLFLILNQPSLK